MKVLKENISCENKNKEQKDPVHIEPLVFTNLPIEDEEYDIIGLNGIIETVKNAIKNGAQMIGIVGDYGTGKTSLIKMIGCGEKPKWIKAVIKRFKWLAFLEPSEKNIITINLWDSISREKGNTDISVNDLVKAFIYQMAVGISRGTAHYVNRRLSKNFGIMSFGVNSAWFWPWWILGAILLIFGQLTSVMDVPSLLQALNNLFAIKKDWLWGILTVMKQGSVLFSGLGACMLIIGLCKTTVAFSKGIKECHEPETNDIFECYSLVYRRSCKYLAHRRYIVIEDLDRIPDKQLVMDFLKEVYRFCNQEFYWKNKKPIFLISVMPESHLKDVKTGNTVDNGKLSEDEAVQSSSSIETDSEVQPTNLIYSKVFDYIINLRPIHHVDYANVLLDLINSNGPQVQKRMCDMFGDEIQKVLPDSFYWLLQGHNLTLRELKIRLNGAISLYINIKNKNYKNDTEINFESCAAVTYLEQQYPSLYSALLSCANELDSIVENAYSISSDKKSNNELDQLFGRKPFCSATESEEMKNDIAQMLECKEINADYRLYFYSFPKNTYVSNELELMLINMIRYPVSNPYKYDQDCESIAALVQRIFKNPHSARYLEIQRAVEERKNNCPSIVFYQKELFELAAAMENGMINLAYSLYRLRNSSLTSKSEKQNILEHVVQYGIDKYYFVWRFFAAINAYGDQSGLLKRQFDRIEGLKRKGKRLIFSETELHAFPLETVAIQMIEPSQIDDRNAEYVFNYLEDKPVDQMIIEHIEKIIVAIRIKVDQRFFKERVEPFIRKYNL